MNNVPLKLRKKWALEDLMGMKRICMRSEEGNCAGRITKEHALIYAGKQVQEEFAILDVCEFHHGVCNYQDKGDLNKEKHVWIALNRATTEELRAIGKNVDYEALKSRLNAKYGFWLPPLTPITFGQIAYA